MGWFLVSAVGLAVLVSVAAVGLAWQAARSLVAPRRRMAVRSPADLGLTFEAITLQGADGIPLAAWWIAAPEPHATVVLVHGFRSSRDEMLDHAPYLHAAGYHVLLFDARACGESGGALSTLGWREQDDLRLVVDWVEGRTAGRPVVVMGHSLGAATAILEGASDSRVAAFVLEAPFTAIDDVVDRGFRHFTRPHLPAFPFAPLAVRIAEWRIGQHRSAVRPVDVIGRLAPRPVLLVSGDLDPFATIADTARLAEHAGPSCTWWRIADAGHPGSDRDPFRTAPDYPERVLTLLAASGSATAASRSAGSSVA